MEHDFWAAGWDFLDVWRGRLSLRKVDAIIANLPFTSALQRRIDPDRERTYAHVLAEIADAVNDANWQRAGNEHAEQPRRYPKPGDEQRAAEQSDRIGARARAAKARQLKREAGSG